MKYYRQPNIPENNIKDVLISINFFYKKCKRKLTKIYDI